MVRGKGGWCLEEAFPRLSGNLSCHDCFGPVGLQLGCGFLTFSFKLLEGATVQKVMSCLDTDEHQPFAESTERTPATP